MTGEKKFFEDEDGIISELDGKNYLEKAYLQIREILSYYLDIDESNKTIMALWVLGTYNHEDFITFPLLFLNAMRGSAKSRTVRLLTKLSKDGQMLMNITEAVLFRSHGTLGIDEFEGLASKEKQSLRELLNSSYKKGSIVKRMRKKKTMEGEQQVEEIFNAYRPVILANIWGIEEVLSDRCITVVLEKSNKPEFVKLMEDYDSDDKINTLLLLLKSDKCSLCSVVTKKNINIYTKWNEYIKNKCCKTTLNTLYTYNTLTTQTTPEEEEIKKINEELMDLFNRVYDLDINGRNLELYFPLFMVARDIGDYVFQEILDIAANNVNVKKIDDMMESSDITLYNLVASCDDGKMYKVKDLVNTIKLMLGEGDFSFINNKWMGRGLKRLNLVLEKRRLAEGIEVRLNVEKAKEKLEMFK